MISTGIVRSIDNLGRVVLPKGAAQHLQHHARHPAGDFHRWGIHCAAQVPCPRRLCILRRDFARRSFAAREVYLPGLPQGTGEIRHR